MESRGAWFFGSVVDAASGHLHPPERLGFRLIDGQDRREPRYLEDLPHRLVQPEHPERATRGAKLLGGAEQNPQPRAAYVVERREVQHHLLRAGDYCIK